MTIDRWQRVKELFEAASQAAPGDREKLLRESGDLELAREVQVLLDACEQSTDFLEESALEGQSELVTERIPKPFTGSRAGPYRIGRQIGEGGMGVVYEGAREDGQFEQRVAIKILKLWMRNDSDISRFRSERQILAGLDHPNIARLLDGGTTPDGLPYYAMEFVEGQYLDDYCRTRQLAPAARLELFRKVCDAVNYAHQRGIIHRDLKPANILVTAWGVPKLLDFGIAKVLEDGAATPRTATLHRVATPYYASPEQLQGDPIDPASDIYSLGVLLYELLTNQHPYRSSGGAVHAVATAICEQDPEPPSKVAGKPEWSRDLDHVVLRAMQKSPAARYHSAAELSAEIGRCLEHQPVRAREGRWRRNLQRTVRRAWRPGAIVAAVLIAGAGVWMRPGASTKTPRRSLAVVGFQNLSGRGDATWIATALGEMLATDMASSERVRVVSSETVNRVKTDLNVADAQNYDDLGRLRTNLDVDYFVTGSYLADAGGSGAPLRLYVRLQDARTGRVVAGASETGTQSELPSLVSEAVGDLLHNPEWSDVARKRNAGVLGVYANPASARLYAEGQERLRRFDTLGARDLFEKAVAADPANPLAHAAYSGALKSLGYEERARTEAKAAFDLSSNLPREERLSVAGRYYQITNNWLQAMATWRSLWELFNDNPEYGLRLASAQRDAGRPTEGLATLQALRAMPGTPSLALRIDLAEAATADVQSDYNRELAAATRALQAASDLKARLLAAEAYQRQGDALNGLNRSDEAMAAYRAAEAIHKELGNSFGLGSILLREAALVWKHGDHAANKEYTEKALALFEQIGNRSAMPAALNMLALAARGHGDLPGALKMMEQAIAISRELGARDNLSKELNNAGNLLRRLNRQEEARRYYEECLSIAVELNNGEQVARSHITLALVDLDEGNLISSSEHVRQALAMATALKNMRLKAVVLQNLGDVKEAQGDLVGARQAYEESVSLSRTLKAAQYIADGTATLADIAREQKDYAAADRFLTEARTYYTSQKQKNGLWETQLTEARIRIDQGAAVGLEKSVEEAVEGFHSIHSAAGETSAYTVLAECLLAERKLPQAKAAIGRGRAAFEATHEFLARTKYRLAEARVNAAGGNRSRASLDLEALVRELESKNWSNLAAQGRQALAEIRNPSKSAR